MLSHPSPLPLADVSGGGNKVRGSYCGEAAEIIVANVVTKGPLLRYCVGMKIESKNKNIRETFLVLLTLVLVH